MQENSSPRLNKLPILDQTSEGSTLGRFPKWLHRSLPKGSELLKTETILKKYNLNTVCEEAKCPNRLECYSNKTATFLVLGKACTRACGFCEIDFDKTPKAPEDDEPFRIAHSVKDLGLNHVVITMVARDDLRDGGANHLKKIMETTKLINPHVTIEILTSDFDGNFDALNIALSSQPIVFNHNIETVRRLTPKVRHKATYERTLSILVHAKKSGQSRFVKSGLMLGLGEEEHEVKETLRDLKEAGCDIVTIGHYLQPSLKKLTVKSFITPEEFTLYADYGHSIGIPHVYSGPFVRSSYNATLLTEQALQGVFHG